MEGSRASNRSTLKLINRSGLDWLVVSVRVGVGLVFFCAGLAKVVGFPAFAEQIERSTLFPELLGWPVGITVPWIETLAGGMLIGEYKTRSAAIVLVLLTWCFLIFLSLSVLAGIGGEFECLSELGISLSVHQALGLDVILLSGAMYLSMVHEDSIR